jgi:HEAT repeat protein
VNPLDELLTIYDGQADPLVRRYLLCSMGLRRLTATSHDLVELLWGQTFETDTRVRHAARRLLGRVFPRYLKGSYGLEAVHASVWTGFQMQAGGGDQDRWQPAWDEASAPVVAGAFALLAPAARKALELSQTGSHAVRQVASLVLGRVPLATSASALAARVGSGKASFHDAAALSELGTPEAHDALLAAARTWGLAGSDLIGLLGAVPPDLTLPVLETMEPRTDPYGRTNVALALTQDRSPRGRELLARLARRREGLLTAYVLDALQAEPMIDDLALLKGIYDAETHDTLRVQALRVTGHAPATARVAFVRSCANDSSHRVRAAALESLARLRATPESLAEVAGPLASSPLLKARVTALLVLAQVDVDRVAAETEALLFSAEPIQRLEGAYVLGYLAGPESAGALHEMALNDPDADVRAQAVKSLARQPGQVGLERLFALLTAPDRGVARLSARLLAQVDIPRLMGVLSELEKAVRGVSDPSTKAVLLRSHGMAAGRYAAAAGRAAMVVGAPGVELLVEHLASPDPTVMRGALEALKFHLGDGAAAPIAPLANHPDPRVRAGAAVLAFWKGDASAAEELASLIAAPAEEVVLAGLNALFECAAVLPGVLAAGRAPALGARPAEAPEALARMRVDPQMMAGDGEPEELWVSVKAPPRLAATTQALRARRAGPPAPRARSTADLDYEAMRKPGGRIDEDSDIERSEIGRPAVKRKTVKEAMASLTPLAPTEAPVVGRSARVLPSTVAVGVLTLLTVLAVIALAWLR